MKSSAGGGVPARRNMTSNPLSRSCLTHQTDESKSLFSRQNALLGTQKPVESSESNICPDARPHILHCYVGVMLA